MYSLGVIAYQLLSGSLPIDPNDLTALILGVGIPARPALAELVPTLDGRIARTLEACLSREPRERPDAAAVVAVLVRAVDLLASTVVGMQAPTF